MGLDGPRALWGLCQLWARAFRLRTDEVSRPIVDGLFPGAHEAGEVLEAFGFLEKTGASTYRIKGAARRLLWQREAQAASGRAHSANLRRGKAAPANPETTRRPPGDHPPAHGPAASGSYTNHQSPITESTTFPTPSARAPSDTQPPDAPEAATTPQAPKPEPTPAPAQLEAFPVLAEPKRKVPDTRHAKTIDLFCRLYSEHHGGAKYRVSAADAAACKRMLSWPEATDAEIERRMRHAFADQFFRDKTPALRDFVSRWNSWAQAQAGPMRVRPPDLHVGAGTRTPEQERATWEAGQRELDEFIRGWP